MPGYLGDLSANATLDWYLGTGGRGNNPTIALCRAEPTINGVVDEVPAGLGYNRMSIPDSPTYWSPAANRQKKNAQTIIWGTPVGSWGLVGWFVIYGLDAAGQSGPYGWGKLQEKLNVVVGTKPAIPPGGLILTMRIQDWTTAS